MPRNARKPRTILLHTFFVGLVSFVVEDLKEKKLLGLETTNAEWVFGLNHENLTLRGRDTKLDNTQCLKMFQPESKWKIPDESDSS
ncbi:MAG: hypothetical protein COA78_28945 [Blastopirellula sp.]|nr:MAG: hypothetical protein COA78_28945 [Blastopirellula sp.]